ncbi:MAG: glycosyltransferase [Anaerolineales bacterium]|nr:glycosyltransferase [Anaerolineales bacterium]
MIVFYNPHVDDFLAEPPHFRLVNRRALKKYGYLIEGILNANKKIKVLVDGTISAFIPDRYFSLLPKHIRQWIAIHEIHWWINLNNLQGKVKIIRNASDADSDVLLAFSYKAATGLSGRQLAHLNTFPVKIFHLSHYFISTKEKSENLQRLSNVLLAGDSDISVNPYFRQYFPWYNRPFVVLPFAVAPRFQVRRSFHNRQPLCVAMGTFHNLHEEVPAKKYLDYIGYFHSSTYHPMRKLIYDNTKALTKHIFSKISLYHGESGSGVLRRLLRHFLVSQKSYFSIDIVDLYNRYRYAIIGEEATGFPALGAFEAMACRCVLIAQPGFYNGLGLVPDEHFVAHNGSLNSVVEAIEMLGKNPIKASLIAEAGAKYVELNLRPQEAYMRFSNVIKGLQ